MVDLKRLYFDIPAVTRTYITLCILTTISCVMELISPYTLYFNVKLIFKKYQFWRLITTFFFFSQSIDLTLFFNLFFLGRYSRRLEEEVFAGKVDDFIYLIIIGSICCLIAAPILSLPFLGSSLTFMLVYVWSRRNPYTRLQFLGLMTFNAPYLPWVLLGLSFLVGHSVISDLLGIAIGHLYYFLKFIFPEITKPNSVNLLKTPKWLQYLIIDTLPNQIDNHNIE